MANKSSQLTVRVLAVDAAARVFKGIRAEAESALGNFAKWGLAIAGVGLGFKGIKDSIGELGKLSDIGAATGSSVKDLTQLSTALDVIGIKGASVEQLGDAFLRMTKETGRTGTAGFMQTIGELSKLTTEQERANAAQEIFGRQGLQFMPLINKAADEGVESIQNVVAAMPGISDAAATAGDNVADSFTVMGNGVKSIWYEVLGKIAAWIDSKFEGGIVAAAMRGVAYMRYFAKVAWAYIKPFFSDFWGSILELGKLIGKWAWNAATLIGGAFVTAFENAKDRIGQFFYNLAAGVDMIWAKLTGDEEGYNRAVELASRENERVAKKTTENWKAYKKVWDNMEWAPKDGPFSKIDTSAAKKELEDQLAAIAKTGKGATKGGKASVDPGLGGAQQAQKTNPEAMLGNSYKAITYAMRAGYATVSDKIIGGIKRAGDFLQKIERNTSDMADRNEFLTVG